VEWIEIVRLVIEILMALSAFFAGREQVKASVARRILTDAMDNGGKPTALGIAKAIHPKEHKA